MEIANILYYTRDEEAGKNRTLHLRDLSLLEEFDLESIFYAARDAIDAQDLLARLSRLIWEKIEFEQETEAFVMFKVYDCKGNTNYLKFKKVRG